MSSKDSATTTCRTPGVKGQVSGVKGSGVSDQATDGQGSEGLPADSEVPSCDLCHFLFYPYSIKSIMLLLSSGATLTGATVNCSGVTEHIELYLQSVMKMFLWH